MLRVQFEEDLQKLHNQFYAMGNEVLSQINRTVRAFVTHDRDLARQVIEDDAEVNEYEVKLEKKSLEIIALQQPVSQDLRTVITGPGTGYQLSPERWEEIKNIPWAIRPEDV